MPTLITTQVQKWQGRLVRKGVQIQATDQEARILIALGRAKPAEETEVKEKRAYKRKDVVKAPEAVVMTPEKVPDAPKWNWPKFGGEE